ncbi:MAG: nucleotidyltransferase family protein [Pseudomonadota bacterium]|nr:nucleotidyltransferase family protein [Pseudomonadota bacterium]
MKLADLEAIMRALNAADVRYLVVGGLAVAAHGYGRVTFDLDLVVQLQPDNAEHALTAFEALGYRPLVPVAGRDFADAAIRESWIQDKGMVVFQLHSDRHPETRVDLFVAEPFDFDQEYDNALVGEIVPGLHIRFVRIETLIRMKETTGREKDREDVRQLRLLLENPDDVH